MGSLSAARPLLGHLRLVARLNRSAWLVHVFSGLLMPLLLLAALAAYVGPAERMRLMLGAVVFGALMAIPRKIAVSAAQDRTLGRRELLASAGLVRSAYLGSMAADAALVALLPLGVALSGSLLFGLAGPAAWGWLPLYALFVGSLYGAALCVAAVARSVEMVNVILNLSIMAALSLCPVTYPIERTPEVLRPLLAALPPSLAAELMTASWQGASLQLEGVLGLAAWSLLLGCLAWWTFPWTDAA
jgi:ABC-type polysaccharide/polyol phosphate export permease